MQSKHLLLMNQLYNEYKVLMGEQKEESSRDSIATQFKQKFLTKFSEMEPTDMIKLCYEYFWGILSESNEKKIFFDYNLLMFEVISSRLVRKPRILDVWFTASEENKRKLMKVLKQAQREVLFCLIPFQNSEIIETLMTLSLKSNLIIKVIAGEEHDNVLNSNQGNIEVRNFGQNGQESYIVIDKRILINGFLAWYDKEKEDFSKNMILIENESLARAFCDNFGKLWEKIDNVLFNNDKFLEKNEKNNQDKNNQSNGFSHKIVENGGLSKKYPKLPLKKFEKLRAKMKRKTERKIINNKRKVEVQRKIEKPKNRGGMFTGLFGFVRKIFR